LGTGDGKEVKDGEVNRRLEGESGRGGRGRAGEKKDCGAQGEKDGAPLAGGSEKIIKDGATEQSGWVARR